MPHTVFGGSGFDPIIRSINGQPPPPPPPNPQPGPGGSPLPWYAGKNAPPFEVRVNPNTGRPVFIDPVTRKFISNPIGPSPSAGQTKIPFNPAQNLGPYQGFGVQGPGGQLLSPKGLGVPSPVPGVPGTPTNMTTGGDQFGPRQYRPGTGLIGATANAIKAALAGNPIAFLAYGVSGFGFYAIGKNKQSILGQPPDPSVAYLIHLRLAQQGLVIDPATGRVVSLIGKKNNQGFNLLLQNDP